eukprot:8296521-Pyramimonas_sp.AAC.1
MGSGPSGTVVWCRKCAAFGVARSRYLKDPCHERPRNSAAEKSLAMLIAGKDPSSRAVFGRSVQVPRGR